MRLQNNNEKLLSVIIPVLNEEKYINYCLSSLMEVNYPENNIEIILVDNGSVDKTLEIAKQYEKVQILQVPDVNISTLRNIGARKAKGNIFAFLDADCMVRRDWPLNCTKYFDDNYISILGADPMIPLDSSWVAQAWGINYHNTTEPMEVQWVASHNLIVRKEIFEELNGFREDLAVSEDVDFCQRARMLNHKIISDSKIAVFHLKNPDTIKDFYRKELWRGKCMTKLFINNLPQLQGIKPLFYGILMLIFLACIPIATLLALYKGKISLSILPIFITLLGPVYLATRSVFKRHQFNYFYHLILLFTVYGIARGIAAVDPKNWQFKQTHNRHDGVL